MTTRKELAKAVKNEYKRLDEIKEKIRESSRQSVENATPANTEDENIKSDIEAIIQLVVNVQVSDVEKLDEEALRALTDNIEKFNEFMTATEKKISANIEALKKNDKYDYYLINYTFFANIMSILEDKVKKLKVKFQEMDKLKHNHAYGDLTNTDTPLNIFLSLIFPNKELASQWITYFDKIRKIAFDPLKMDPNKEDWEKTLTSLKNMVLAANEKNNESWQEIDKKNNEKKALLTQALEAVIILKEQTLDLYKKKNERQNKLQVQENNINKQKQMIKDSKILEDLDKLMQELLNEVAIFDESKNPEATDEQRSAAKSGIKEVLDDVMTDKELHHLDSILKIDTCSLAINDINEKINKIIADKTAILARLNTADHIIQLREERSRLVEEFQNKYINAIDPVEAVRQGYLKPLHELLEPVKTWGKTADGAAVLDHLLENASLCKNEAMKRVLDKIIVQIIDAQRLVANGYKVPLLKEVSTLSEAWPDESFRIAIEGLYKKVDVMTQHAKTIEATDAPCAQIATDLAEALQRDIGYFLAENKGVKPSETSYKRFEKIFSARLNSKHDDMSKHREPWKVIVGNILIGMATLGIAILLKLAITHEFFFQKTKRQQQVDAIGESLQPLTVALKS